MIKYVTYLITATPTLLESDFFSTRSTSTSLCSSTLSTSFQSRFNNHYDYFWGVGNQIPSSQNTKTFIIFGPFHKFFVF